MFAKDMDYPLSHQTVTVRYVANPDQRAYGTNKSAAKDECFQVSAIRIRTERHNSAASSAATATVCREKKRYDPKRFRNALRTKKLTIQTNRRSRGKRFHVNSADAAVSIKIIVQINPISCPGGVHAGRLMVWYHSIPTPVMALPIDATKSAIIGMTTKLDRK